MGTLPGDHAVYYFIDTDLCTQGDIFLGKQAIL